MTSLALAGISVRMLAEAAAADGFDVIALDLFGDADTRRASAGWHAIGDAGALQIDGERLLAALVELAQSGGVRGWIAGSGFDGRPDLLARGAAVLPLIGTQADAVRRVRDPNVFFGVLDKMQIAHPAVRMQAPDDAHVPGGAAGWLRKDAGACGGWHIRHAAMHAEGALSALESPAHPRNSPHYYQRRVIGAPMSATFIADGKRAVVLGFNRLIVRRFGAHPFVYGGAIGPVRLAERAAGDVIAAVRAVTEAFMLQGLGSLDFMLDGDEISVLEVNPRPPASMSLYGRSLPSSASQGVLAAHVQACVDGSLHAAAQEAARAGASRAVRGSDIVFARRRLALDDAAVAALAALPYGHDLPHAATSFEAGDPVCSVSAEAEDAGADPGAHTDPNHAADRVQTLLTERRHAVRQFLETLT